MDASFLDVLHDAADIQLLAVEQRVELIELHRQARREGWSKHEFLVCAAQIPGVYVPSLYDVAYNDDGTVTFTVWMPSSQKTYRGVADMAAGSVSFSE